MNPLIEIHFADGGVRKVPLSGSRLAVGRSSTAELSFPEETGLSRQHFVFECRGDDWTVRDLDSKNGTFVNDLPLQARHVLKPGDRITAGNMTVVYSPPPEEMARNGGVVFQGEQTGAPSTASMTLEGALAHPFRLQALIKAGEQLSESRPLAELFQVILDLAIQAVNARRGVVMILEDGELVLKAHEGDGFRISTTVRDQVLHKKTSILVRDTSLDAAFKSLPSIVDQRVHTMMAVPLQAKDRIIGLIYVDSPSVMQEFTIDDLSLLAVMGNIAAVRLENARLTEIEQAERIMKRDLMQAAEIQRRILPEEAPHVPGLDLAGFNLPCRTVGGDYYGFFQYRSGRIGLALGDVAGKGMPAALMVMALDARLRVLTEDDEPPEMLVTRLNNVTCASCPSNRFITFFYGVLNPATGNLAYANAGHNPPFLVRSSGDVEALSSGGAVLGVIPNTPYSESAVTLASGDLFVIYSDGVTDATNTAEEEYGEARLINVLRQDRNEPAASIVNRVMESLNEFTAGAPQVDDITLVVARRLG